MLILGRLRSARQSAQNVRPFLPHGLIVHHPVETAGACMLRSGLLLSSWLGAVQFKWLDISPLFVNKHQPVSNTAKVVQGA